MTTFIITFLSTHQALKGEKYLESLNLGVNLIPTPTLIFAECGFSAELKIDKISSEKQIFKVIKELNYDNIYKVSKGNNSKKTYILVEKSL